MPTAYLILENGAVFEGVFFGAQGDVTGEIVFTTGMTGYLETLTDPSYYGQMVVQTFPLIGNCGVIPADFESTAVSAKAYIVKHPCQAPSNFRSEGSLDAFLKARGVTGLCGIDTRALTRHLRMRGVMNGAITTDTPTPERKNALLKEIALGLRGKEMTAELIEETAQAISDFIRPIDDNRTTAEYRTDVAKVIALDAIADAFLSSGGTL